MKYTFAFMGTPEITHNVLEMLRLHPLINLAIIIAPLSKKAHRGGTQLEEPYSITYAKTYGIDYYQSEKINKDEELFSKLCTLNLDVLLVFAFSQFLGKRYLDLPKLGAFNIHTSLLPKFRGASPIHHAILLGEKKTGVSLQKMVAQMDAGDCLLQPPNIVECSIEEFDTTPILQEKLKNLSALCVYNFIHQIHANTLNFRIQDPNDVSFAPIIKKEDGFIDFKTHTSLQILRALKAYNPWPGVSFLLNDQRIQLIEGHIETNEKLKKKKLLALCKDGVLLHLKAIKLPGKKTQNDYEFLNGFRGELPHETYSIA